MKRNCVHVFVTPTKSPSLIHRQKNRKAPDPVQRIVGIYKLKVVSLHDQHSPTQNAVSLKSYVTNNTVHKNDP